MTTQLETDWLFRVRVVIARCGEMDAMKWWNTEGQLGSYGSRVLKRGFPRTHFFAQTRSVFSVATHRCAEVFDPPNSATFWRVSDDVEEAFDARWEAWLDTAADWTSFFVAVAALESFNVVAALKGFSLVDDADIDAASRLRLSDGGKGVCVTRPLDLARKTIALLALGFGRGGRGKLLVPYAPAK